ncbi:hypothetical protein [Herbidospora sp. NBRC 101105]|uniref:hypothetical protein n=1 Tax=Herbidospora sp. NBRC 101105 TaxID=3032195 RepID=UPI0024A2D574|nr:hypothetical protein [Herbidospora sp. NBRC 101105]GLX94541.1 hypothetical protein Hesp01_24910 [Herbidospora sp. NBRC 101105]
MRLIYWSLVISGSLSIGLGWLFGVERYPSTDSPEIDPDGVAFVRLLVGFGMTLMLCAVICRWKFKKSWMIPGLFLALGLWRLIWVQLQPGLM